MSNVTDKLYGEGGTLVPGPAPAPRAPSGADGFAPVSADEARISESLYDGNQAAPAIAPPNAENFYGYSSLTGALNQELATLWEETGASAAEQQQIRDDFAGMAHDTGLNDPLLARLAEGYVGQLRTAARPVDDADAAAQEHELAQRIARQTIESRAVLKDRYGAKDVDALVERTVRFVTSHPSLLKVMSHGGIGSRPDIVEQLVEHVFSNGIR